MISSGAGAILLSLNIFLVEFIAVYAWEYRSLRIYL